MTKRRCILEISFLLLLAALFAWGTALERQQQRISNSMLRLHVVAASDSKTDQDMKLQVRDAVLAAAEPYLQEADSVQEVKAILKKNLTALQATADEVLQRLGSENRASLTVQRELFGTRNYEGFSLPGGYYDALRVTIGPGEGKNWWCVVYPQICMASSVRQQEAVAVMGGMESDDAALITGQYELKFKTLELFEGLMGWFRTIGKGIPPSQ